MTDLVPPPPPMKELPPEIWKKVLSNLDEPSLLTCRKVNRSWKCFANEFLLERNPFWDANFESPHTLFSIPLGTHFSTPEQLKRFMEEMKETPNPFPNGTVIFNPDKSLSTDKIVKYQAKVCELLEVFQDSVLNLVYRLNDLNTEDLDISPQLLKILSLKKLKRLAIDVGYEYLEPFRSIRSRKWFEERLEEANFPENLSELYISGYDAAIPLFCMFGKFQSILKSVEILGFCNDFTIDVYHKRLDFPIPHFPSLKKLKASPPTLEFLKQFEQFRPNCVASLREVYFLFPSDIPAFKEIFELLDFHSKTLEKIRLNFTDSSRHEAVIFPVKYPKLETLYVSIDKINRWPLTTSELMAKFVNLREVILVDLLEYDLQILPPKEQYEKVMACWNLFPATVMVIHVPEYGWRIKRGETLQFGFKY